MCLPGFEYSAPKRADEACPLFLHYKGQVKVIVGSLFGNSNIS